MRVLIIKLDDLLFLESTKLYYNSYYYYSSSNKDASDSRLDIYLTKSEFNKIHN